MDDGREIRKISREAFPYPVFGRFSYILSALVGLGSANIRQPVREQSDT